MATKSKERAEAIAEKNTLQACYLAELTSLFCNAVKINGLPDDVPPEFIMLELLKHGRVAEKDGSYYRADPTGSLDRYGQPAFYNLMTGNGIAVFPKISAKKCNIIKANAIAMPYYEQFDQLAERLATMDASINVNLLNSQTAWLLLAEDDATAKQIKEAYDDMTIGIPAVVKVKSKLGDATIDSKPIGVTFIADRIHELRIAAWEDGLKRCGIVSANSFGPERTQTAQVNAGAGESIDYIYTLIDTANRDAERAGLGISFEFNGFAATYDEADESTLNDPDVIEDEGDDDGIES